MEKNCGAMIDTKCVMDKKNKNMDFHHEKKSFVAPPFGRAISMHHVKWGRSEASQEMMF